MSEFEDLLKKFEGSSREVVVADDKPVVLVIDDDESICRGLSRILSKKYQVLTADSGYEGLDLLSSQIYCVVLDVKMKKMDGFETFPKLKEKCPDVLIIFYTAFQSEHDLYEIINKFKPEGYVEKGKDINFLEHLIENAVKKYRLVLENKKYQNNLEQLVEERTIALQKEKEKVLNAQEILTRYVPPQLAKKILNGQFEEIKGHYRKKMTMFFSDIKDFTPLSDAMEPEDFAILLNNYFSLMYDISKQYGGTLANITGDALFIFFGAPEATNDKDHALRCVQMAVDMQRSMEPFQKKWFEKGLEHSLQIRCGINTGMVTVGGFGSKMRKEYTAMGMHVNLAARLENICEPGQILISHATWALVNDQIKCQFEGEKELKGLSRTSRVYTVDMKAGR
jgi:class 3 adenylate cyclase/ActR/RegA family two-component response regulator